MCSNFSYVTKGTETDNTSLEIIICYINLTDLFGLTSQKISAVMSEVLHLLGFFSTFLEVIELVSETISDRNSL